MAGAGAAMGERKEPFPWILIWDPQAFFLLHPGSLLFHLIL
jgi:hypothetical protein